MTEGFQIDHHIPGAEALALEVPPPAGALSREQILSRHILVALHRELEHGSSEEFPYVEQLSAMDADEARLLVQEDQVRARETGFTSERLRQYNQYVADLAVIRANQQEHVNKVLHNMPQDAPMDAKRAAFLNALDHSPHLAEKTMHKLNHVAVNSRRLLGKKLFNEAQIAEVSTDREAFQQALVQVMLREPAIVLGAGSVLSKVANTQQIHTALESLRETNREEFINHLDFALQHYSPEEGREMVVALAEADPSTILFKLIRPPVAELVGEDVQRRIAQKALREGSYMPGSHLLESCLAKGFITPDLIKERLFVEIKKRPDWSAADIIQNDRLVSPEDAAEARKLAYDIYQAADNGLFKTLERCGLLSEEQKETLVRGRSAANPAEFAQLFTSMADKYLPSDQIRELLLERMTTDKHAFNRCFDFLMSEALTADDKRQYIAKLALKNPSELLSHLDYMNGTYGDSLLTHQEVSQIVRQIAGNINLEYNTHNIRRFIEYIGGPEDQKAFIMKGFLESPTLDLFTSANTELLEGLFTSEERIGMLNYAVSQRIAKGNITKFDLSNIRNAFGEADYRSIVDTVRTDLPESFLSAIDEIAYLYSGEELAKIVGDIGNTDSGQLILLRNLTTPDKCWLDFVGSDRVEEFVSAVRPKYYAGLVDLNERLSQYLDPESMKELALKIAQSNPALSLMMSEFFTKHIPDFSQDNVAQQALKNEQYMSVMDKYLTETMRNVQKANPAARDRLLVQMSGVYEILGEHAQSGTLDNLRALHDKLNLGAGDEQALLEMYDIVAKVGSSDALSELRELNSMEAINHQTIKVIAEAVGITEDVTSEQASKLLGALQQSGPLGLYISQYVKSPEHTAVLKPIVEGLLQGNYKDWKFGSPTPENLQMLKAEGLLPSNLTLEQYELWGEESHTNHVEAFTVESQAVTAEVRRILGDNALTLPPDSIVDASQKGATLQEISTYLSEVGQEIGNAHQELKVLQAQSIQELAEGQIEEIRTALSEMTQARRMLQIQQDVIQLTHMTDEEVRSGVLQPLTAGGKGRPLVQALQRLRKELGPNVRFISEQLDQVFESFNAQTGALQALDVVDTIDPRRTVEIGETPIASCQNYRNGVMNECLLGYTDPNTKILFLTNERGNPVARSVLRLLADQDGNPTLHIEAVYSADASDGVQRAIYRHAVQKAEAMNTPVYLSLLAQNVDGQETEARRIKGVNYQPSQIKLSSKGSRAPWVYVDSSGGPQKNGVYTVENNARISLTD